MCSDLDIDIINYLADLMTQRTGGRGDVPGVVLIILLLSFSHNTSIGVAVS